MARVPWLLDQPAFPPRGPQLDPNGHVGLVDHLPRASGGLLLEPAANLAEIGERGKVDGEAQPRARLGPQAGRGAGDAAEQIDPGHVLAGVRIESSS